MLTRYTNLFDTRGGVATRGRCEVCNDVLDLEHETVCEDCALSREDEENT